MNIKEYEIQHCTNLCETGLLPLLDTVLPPWSLQAYNKVLAECGGWIDPEFRITKKINPEKIIEPILIAKYLLESSRALLLEEGYQVADIDKMSHASLYEYYRDRLELNDLIWLATNHVTAGLAITLLTPFHKTFLELRKADTENITGSELIKIITAQAFLASAQECHSIMTRDTYIAQQKILELVGERQVIDFQLSKLKLKKQQSEGAKKGRKSATLNKEKTLLAGTKIIKQIISEDKNRQLMTGRAAEITRQVITHYWEQIGLPNSNVIPSEKWFREEVINKTPEAAYMSSKKGKNEVDGNKIFNTLRAKTKELYLPGN